MPVLRAPGAPAPGTELHGGWGRAFATPGAGLWDARFYAGEGATVTGRFVVLPELQGGPGIIHGGVMATIFDEIQGMSSLITHLIPVTAHLEVDYRRPIPVGATVELKCEVQGRLRRKVYTYAAAYIEGELAASSKAIFVVIDPDTHYGEGAGAVFGISP